MENLPTDYVNGTDSRLTKTTKGRNTQTIQQVNGQEKKVLPQKNNLRQLTATDYLI